MRKLADGNFELQVHIADVAQYVTPDSALDQEARLRGTSVYFPDRAVPMLPEALSSGMCSLNPREDRLVMSALMEFDPAGNLKSSLREKDRSRCQQTQQHCAAHRVSGIG